MSNYRKNGRGERRQTARHLRQAQNKNGRIQRQYSGAANHERNRDSIIMNERAHSKSRTGLLLVAVLLMLLVATGMLLFSALSVPAGGIVADMSAVATSEAPSKEVPNTQIDEPKKEEPIIRYASLIDGNWQDTVTQDAVSGSSGEQEAVVQAMRLELSTAAGEELEYCVADGSGTWTDWLPSGTQAGDNGISAIRIAVKGELAQNYNVWYCACVAGIGWKDWTSNGDLAGASGIDAKLTAYRVTLLPKSAAAPGPTEEPFQKTASFTSGDAELDAILERIAAEHTGTDQDALRNAYEYVSTFYYTKQNELPEGDWSTWSVPYAKEMYNNGEGNCYRFASLFCWIARYLGYDARVISGRVPMPEGIVPHGWVEIRENGAAYVYDADMHKFKPDVDLYGVTYDESRLAYYHVDYTPYTNDNALE